MPCRCDRSIDRSKEEPSNGESTSIGLWLAGRISDSELHAWLCCGDPASPVHHLDGCSPSPASISSQYSICMVFDSNFAHGHRVPLSIIGSFCRSWMGRPAGASRSMGCLAVGKHGTRSSFNARRCSPHPAPYLMMGIFSAQHVYMPSPNQTLREIKKKTSIRYYCTLIDCLMQ